MKYRVIKQWYDDKEIIESDLPLTFSQIRDIIDEKRLYCDEIIVEEIEETIDNGWKIYRGSEKSLT